MKLCFASLLFALAAVSFTTFKSTNPITIKGVITDGKTNGPVLNVYIAAVQGEE